MAFVPRVTKEEEAAIKIRRFEGVEHVDISKTKDLAAAFARIASDIIGWHTTHHSHNVYPLDMIARQVDAIDAGMAEQYNTIRTTPLGNELFKILYERKEIIAARIQHCIDRGEIEFEDLTLFFKKGQEVYTVDYNGEIVAGIIDTCLFQRGFFENRCIIRLRVVQNMTHVITDAVYDASIHSFVGLASIAGLRVKTITPEIRAILHKRGERYAKHVIGCHYIQYAGQMTRSSWWSIRTYRADGRLMIDQRSFAQIDHDQFDQEKRASGLTQLGDEDVTYVNGGQNTVIPPSDYWRTFPYLYGFSFRAKTWGKISVKNISDIQWRDDSFDKLVLADDTKKLIRALVEHSGGSFSDVIEGKGGGCIFLLHGPPGQGKTLTAETIAELLHRPLYAISVGELGVTPDQLEARLRIILDVALTWNAVILLDEADIYLEERDEHDIMRNSMVGVFLRLLEYHQGVLFLTTNRVRQIDRAFYSRISVAINFEHGNYAKRAKIWHNLLDAAGVKGLNIDKLAVADINGRQIKNVIRLAQTLSTAEQKPITTERVLHIINLATKFEVERRHAEEEAAE